MMKLIRKAVALAGAAAMMASCNHMKQIKHMPYPETQRTDVADDYFGTKVADPYRWLEDDNSEATAAWVKAQNAVTQDYLSQIPFRDAIRGRLTQLWNYPKEGIPAKHGDAWYYFYNDGLRNQSVLYRTTAPGAEGEVFLDPNTLSDDGTVALSSVAFSKDGKYCACAVAESGSDWVEIRVMNTADRKFTTDKINWVKFSGAEWAPDSKGFYYSAYDAPEKGVFSSQNQFQKVYYHRLGTPQSADKLIYKDAEHPLRYFSAWPSKDGKWLFISASEGTSGTEILYKKVSEPKFRTLLPGFEADYALVECRDDQLYYITNKDASNYALMKVDLNAPSSVTAVIPENEKSLLENVTAAGGYFFASYLQDAQSKVVQYGFDGRPVRDVALPGICTASGFDGDDEAAEIYYSVSGYTAPATIYKYDVVSGESTLFKAPEVNFDPALFTTEQVFYTSKDGTKVPMFITHRKDLKLDGKNPCYLYAYGGFQINRTPGFRPSAIMFVEQGSVTIVFQTVGASTTEMAKYEVGESFMDFVGPLGCASELIKMPLDELKKEKILFVCGGVGTAPVYPQVKWMKEHGVDVDVIIGARTKDIIILENEMREVAANLYIATDDGSYEFKGNGCDKINDLIGQGKEYTKVVAIGPMIMMKFVCKLTKELGIPTIVSMNPIMVDGTGMCGACRLKVGDEIKFACVDGPEFDGHLVDFDQAMLRQRMYKTEEGRAMLKLQEGDTHHGGCGQCH